MPYRIDFHSHTGHSSDSLTPAAQLLEAAIRAGLAALTVTDHNNIGGAMQAVSLVQRQPERFGSLIVYPGEEVMTREGEIIGVFLRSAIPRGLTPEETITRIRDQGGLVLVPHPFDRARNSRLAERALERVAGLVDAIETFNSRTTLPADNARAVAFAAAHGLPAVGGSDAHTPGEVGNAYLEIDEPPARDPAGLLAQIKGGRVGGRSSHPAVHIASKAAKWGKRLGLAPQVRL